jgi:hypothetical protein
MEVLSINIYGLGPSMPSQGLNPGGQVSPQGTQPTELVSIHSCMSSLNQVISHKQLIVS